jgi:hypothetical protein
MTLARRLSFALAVLAVLTGTASFAFWELFSRDVPGIIGNLRGTALTLAVIVVPTMLLAMRLARRGSSGAAVLWLACLAYVAYNAVMFCFSAHFNSLFLAFTALLGLSFWAIVALVRVIDLTAMADRSRTMHTRAISVYLICCCVAFAGLWLASIVPATIRNEMPGVITESGLTQNTVWVIDMAFSFPLMMIGAIWLWQRKPWGVVVGGMMVMMLTLETAGVAIDQWFGHFHDPSQPLATVPLMVILTVIGTAFSAFFMRGLPSE